MSLLANRFLCTHIRLRYKKIDTLIFLEMTRTLTFLHLIKTAQPIEAFCRYKVVGYQVVAVSFHNRNSFSL